MKDETFCDDEFQEEVFLLGAEMKENLFEREPFSIANIPTEMFPVTIPGKVHFGNMIPTRETFTKIPSEKFLLLRAGWKETFLKETI